MKRVPKLGLMYLSAVLEKMGIATSIWDQSLETFTLEKLLQELSTNNYLLAGFYSSTTLSASVSMTIRAIRDRNLKVPIIVGGPDFHREKDFLDAGGDIVCRGEGERTIVQIVEYLSGSRSIDSIKGIFYRDGDRIVATEPQPLIEDLDEIPMPKRNPHQQPTDYYDYHIINMKTPFTTMLASRGCPHVCTYCSSYHFWGNRVRQRSVASVIQEIDYCVNEIGIKYIGFRDDLFGANPAWVEEFCHALISRGHDVLWSCMVHPFSFRGRRQTIIPLMKKAGCDMLIFGMQSADPQILKNIRRHPDEPAELVEAIQTAKREDISTVITSIFGLPGETQETMRKTISYLLKVKPHYTEFNTLVLLEGSEMMSRYANSPVSQFPESEVRKWCSYAGKKFYGNPGVIVQNTLHVLRKNPRFFLKVMQFLPYVGKYTGFKKFA